MPTVVFCNGYIMAVRLMTAILPTEVSRRVTENGLQAENPLLRLSDPLTFLAVLPTRCWDPSVRAPPECTACVPKTHPRS